MVTATIRNAYAEPFNGKQYPAVEVVFADGKTELGATTYVLRPGSAVASLDDVAAAAKTEAARIEAALKNPDDPPPLPVPPDVQAAVAELRKKIGEPVDTKLIASTKKPKLR